MPSRVRYELCVAELTLRLSPAGSLITAPTTYTIGPSDDFAGLAAAFAFLQYKFIAAPVTLQLTPGVINHPDLKVVALSNAHLIHVRLQCAQDACVNRDFASADQGRHSCSCELRVAKLRRSLG
jgi:hypothetical protein